jgi:hypothetical protein
MPIQTHHIGLSGMTYRTEDYIYIEDPVERVDSLEFLRQELSPTDHQKYQSIVRSSTIITGVDNFDLESGTKDIPTQGTSNKYNLKIQQKTLKYLQQKCCIFL